VRRAVAGRDSGRRRVKPFASLLTSVAGARIEGNAQVPVTDVCYDSREVTPGAAFICVRGEKTDGHLYIPQALDQGAVALVVESLVGRACLRPPPSVPIAIVPDTRLAMAPIAVAFYDHPSASLILAGVTGTNGKTTAALILHTIFRAAGLRSGLIGTVEYLIGDRVLKPLHTTPEAIDLQKLLSELVDAGGSHAAMEVSSHAIALHRVEGTEFAAAVFTNLTPEHLDFHPDMRHYLETKKRLFTDQEYFPANRERVNAINVDDAAGGEIAQAAAGRTLTYAVDAPADCRAEDIALGVDGTSFTAVLPDDRVSIRTRLLGRFNVYNALAAITAAVGLGIPVEAAQQALETMEPVRGRFHRVPATTRQVVVDYAHTPDGLQRALETARQLSRGRVIVVFGCGGDRDRSKRPVMGGIASRLADRCIITSDNPRREKPEAIIEEIVAGVDPSVQNRCLVEPDRAAAIRIAIAEAKPEDLVLIAGKGHEDYQILADRTIHLDDREVAVEVLREIEGETDA